MTEEPLFVLRERPATGRLATVLVEGDYFASPFAQRDAMEIIDSSMPTVEKVKD